MSSNPDLPSGRTAAGGLRLLAATLCIASSLVVPALALAGTRVFHDSFEDGTTNAFTSGAYEKCVAVSTSVDGRSPVDGRFMAQCNWNGWVAWNDPRTYSHLQLDAWPYNREFLLRFWVRMDNDRDPRDGAKFLRLGAGTGNDSYWEAQASHDLKIYWGDDTGRQFGGTFWGWGGSTYLNGGWHRIEVYIKHDTNGADGVIKVWMDGVNVQTVTGQTSKAGGRWYPLNIMSNWSSNPGWEHDASNHAYFDAIEVFSDATNGQAMTGNLFDATAAASGGTVGTASVAPPRNLRTMP